MSQNADGPALDVSDVAAIVLAAGRGARFAGGPDSSKAVAELEGRALVRRVVDAALGSRASEVVIVTGHAAADVSASLGGLPVLITHNPAYAEGVAGSLQAGLAALSAHSRAALILLADMPRVRLDTLDRLIAAFEAEPTCDAVCPRHAGQRGNPVLLARSLFQAVGDLHGDEGARHLIADPDRRVAVVEVDDPGVLIDVDTKEMLAALHAAPAQAG